MVTKEPVIEIKNLNAGYGDRQILFDINLTIYRGEIVALIGQSGCGKTTLLRCLTGLLTPLSGEINILGYTYPIRSERKLHNFLRRIGMVFQQNALLGSLTIGQNVELPLEEHTQLPPEIRKKMVESVLAQVGLEGTYYKYPNELSGGMQKRAALARAIILQPEILFCDEPIAGLDPVVGSGIDRLLLNLARQNNLTVVMVTHELGSIMSIVDRAVMIVDGKIHAQGHPEQLYESRDRVVYNFFHRTPPEEYKSLSSLIEFMEGK